MASISLASQYFGNEGVPFVIQPTISGLVGETYKWFFNGTLIPGQTGPSLIYASPTPSDSGTYTVIAASGGNSYSANTYVDIIQALPTNYQRGVGESATLSIQPIPGATYQWVRAERIEEVPSILSGKTGITNTYSAVSSTDYGVIKVQVSKNGVIGFSNECCFTDYTSITMDRGLSQSFTFPNSTLTYTFLETSPDGRLVFIDDATPRTLWITAPGFVHQTSFEKNIQLYELPKPSINTSPISASSSLPQLRAYYGIFGQTSTSNVNYYFMDEFRSYTDDGKYLAVVCNGLYAVRSTGTLQTHQVNFVVVYKLEGTTITVAQTLFNCPFSSTYNGYIVNNQTSISASNPPVTVTFSGNGTYLGIMYGSSYADTGNTFRVYKKNDGDTWGDVVSPTTTGNSFTNVEHTFLVTPRTTGSDTLIYAGRFNSDGSFLSLCSVSASNTHILSQLQNFFIYTINTITNAVTRNTSLESKLMAELQKITNTTSYNRDDSISLPILFYFPRNDTSKLIGYNNILSSSQVVYKNNIYTFSYNASTETPTLIYNYNLSFFPGNNGTPTTNPSQTFFQISDDGTYLLNTWNQNTGVTNKSTKRIYKIPAYYHNKINGTTGEISSTNERSYVQYVHLFETSNIEINTSYNGHIHGNKLIIFNSNNKKIIVKNIVSEIQNVKPTITDTSSKIYIDQDESASGSEISIRSLLSNKSFFQAPPKGILLRIKNNRDASGNQVAFWKFKSDYATNNNLVNFSNTYTSSNEDKWYIFYSDDNTSIRLDMDPERFFNNSAFPENKITLEYKLWSGFGWNNPGFDSIIYTKNDGGFKNAYTLNGSVVTIADINNTPFSNETGQLQIFIKRVINTPDPFGYIYPPLTTTGTGSIYNDSSRRYVYSMDVLKNSLSSKPFSLRDIIHIFLPTMSTTYPTNTTIPYSAENYKGGIGIYVRSKYTLQISLNNGNTWYFLPESASAANLAYFFNLKTCNYLFRYARQGGSTTNLMNQHNVYIFPWNGTEISVGTDTYIKEFSSTSYIINAFNEIILTTPTKVSINEIEDADSPSFPDKGCYVTGDTSRLVNTSGLWANIINSTKPQFKNTNNRTYALKTVNTNGSVIDAFTNDTDTSINTYSFTPNDIFYGKMNGAVRTTAFTIRPGISINDTCDVYDPDISGDEQLLGLIIPRDSSVLSLNGKWQYTINAGSTWVDVYESASSTNVIRFWSNIKTDNRICLRFLPNIVKKTTVVSLPFYLYDGADFIPYAVDNNYESAAYRLNGAMFPTIIPNNNSDMLSGRSELMGELTLKIVHVNSAPVLNINTYTPLVSSTYKYNSENIIYFNNTYPIHKNIESITYETTYTNEERTEFITTSTRTTSKNAFRINVADIVNSSAISNPADSEDSMSIVLYSGDFINTDVKVYYTDGSYETLTNVPISQTNAFLIPNYIPGSPSSYTNFHNIFAESFMTTSHVKGWIQPNHTSYVSRTELSGNEIASIRDFMNTDPNYYLLQNATLPYNLPCSPPTLIPNIIHGLPVMRFERAKSTVITPLFEQADLSAQADPVFLKNTYIIVERPKSVDASGFNALIGDSQNNYFFGYTNRNTITLTYNNRGTPKTISYSDSTIDIDSTKTQRPRVWTIFIGDSQDKVQLNLNGKMVALMDDNTKPSTFLDNSIPRLGGYINWNGVVRHYDGDVCDIVSLNGLSLSQIKMFENYLISTWVNPQIYIEPLQNTTIDLSYSFYIWDGSNRADLETNYTNVQTRGSNTPYSINGSTFTIRVSKSNTRPALLIDTFSPQNRMILPTNSTPSKLAFRLAGVDMSIRVHDFSLISIFDDIIKNRYIDVDLGESSPDSKGLAITHVDETLGSWSVVKSDGSVEILTNISTSNAYLIKRDTSGNCLRLTLSSSTNPALNRFHTLTAPGIPGNTCIHAIAWDATNPSYSEYSKVDLNEAADPNDSENSFSVLEDGVFEFCVSTRPYISGKLNQTLFVYNLEQRNSSFTPMSLLQDFNTSEIAGNTKRIDIYNIDNLESGIILQYNENCEWKDIVLPLSSPINGNYPIRVKETTAFRAINTTFTILMTLYDDGTELYSPNFGSISVQVQEANLPPSIQTNPSAIVKTRISNITSSTITYEAVLNNIENKTDPTLAPLFDFKKYTSFNSASNIKPIIWTDRNIGSNLKLNSFAIQIVDLLNGRLYYADDNEEFKNVIVNKESDLFLLSSANTLKYIPTYGNTGKAVIRIYAWDGVLGTVGTRVEADVSGMYSSSAFSSNYITLEFPVISPNNPPTFVENNKLYSSAVPQTDTNTHSTGVSVKSIIDDTIGFDYIDPDTTNEKGIAVIDPSGAHMGVWQASIDAGTTWMNIEAGLHLLADTNGQNRIRYIFDISRNTFSQSYSVIPTLRIVAWDKSNNVENGAVNLTELGSGYSTAYSTENVYIGAQITHRNHAPTLASGSATFNIGSVAANSFIDIPFQTLLTAIGNGIISDPDEGDAVGIKIIDISFNNIPSRGASMGSWSYTDSILNNYTPINSNSPAELIPSRNPILRFYADKYVYGTTQLTFRAFDGELTSANTRTLTLNVTDINYAPSITKLADISYNVTFDVPYTITVSSIINALCPFDLNVGTSYGIVISASSFDPNVAVVKYTLNNSASIPVYNTIVNSRIGIGSTAIHLPSSAAIQYTPKLNKAVQISFDILLWDRSNNSSVVAAAGYAVEVPSIRNEFSSYSVSTVKLLFNHQQINYAPVITSSTNVLQTLNALNTSSSYTVSTLLSRIGYTDPNASDARGIALIGVDMCGGHYEYTINGGSSWSNIPTNLSALNALHLTMNGTSSAIRYVSTRNTTDYSTLTIVGWDQTAAYTNGTLAAIPSTRGGNTSYSSNSAVLRFEQNHVNTRPVINPSAGINRSTPLVNYSTLDYTWFQFRDYIPIDTAFSDEDYNLVKRDGIPQVEDKTYGILITSADISAGTWLISSDKKIITDITSVTPDSARIVSPDDYFALRTGKNMDVSFNMTYKAWDKSRRTTSVTVDTTDSTNTSYSVNSGSIIIPVKHINTPPIINSTGTGFQASTIYGDGDDNQDISGISVASIIEGLILRGIYTDLDKTLWGYTNESAGIIILGSLLNATTGTWSYSINGGDSWTAIPFGTSEYLHLSYSASNRIRFRPSANSTGSASLRIAAWDQSNGVANGAVQSVASAQRTGALGQSYSVNETTVVFPTSYINHVPSFGGVSYTMPVVEYGLIDDGKDWACILNELSYTDKDTLDPRGVVIDSITIPSGLTGTFQILRDTSWNTLTTGLQFTLPTYKSLRFIPTINITDELINASITIRPYDGTAIGTTVASIIVPVKKAFFSPTYTTILPTNRIVTFRADNKLNPFGGVVQGVTLSKILNDMDFTSQSANGLRGIAIQTLAVNGVSGYFEVKFGNAPWERIPSIPINNFYHITEYTNGVANRIRFFSTNPASTGFVTMLFYNWDQSNGATNGTLSVYTAHPDSFSDNNGIYRMNIQYVLTN